jgi:addiction module RelB/DinJ family antitoxin
LYCILQYVQLGDVDSFDILRGMPQMTRSAMLQMRVTPAVKHASEQIFHRIGLTMTQAMELFLRRVIVDEKLPFEVIALDAATLSRITENAVESQRTLITSARAASNRRTHRRPRSKGG